jgi:hypothetical protein
MYPLKGIEGFAGRSLAASQVSHVLGEEIGLRQFSTISPMSAAACQMTAMTSGNWLRLTAGRNETDQDGNGGLCLAPHFSVLFIPRTCANSRTGFAANRIRS